jgi:hypothetical protein
MSYCARRSLAASAALLAGALALALPAASSSASNSRVGGMLGNSTVAAGSIEFLGPDSLGTQGSPQAGQKAPDPTAVEY